MRHRLPESGTHKPAACATTAPARLRRPRRRHARALMYRRRHDRHWHKADMNAAPRDVRFWMHSGRRRPAIFRNLQSAKSTEPPRTATAANMIEGFATERIIFQATDAVSY